MAVKKVKSSKPRPVAKTVKPKAKTVSTRAAASVKKNAPVKKAASSAKPVKSQAAASRPSAPKAKASAVKKPSVTNVSSKKKVPRPAAPAAAPARVKVAAATVQKTTRNAKSAAGLATEPSVGVVHETASTISTGPRLSRSFSTIMQGHADIAKGIEARKAAAKAKNLARLSRPAIARTKTTRKLTSKQSKEYEQMLLRLRDELSRQIAFLRGASLTRSDEVNPEEDGSDAFERQLALKLASNEGDAIFEIDEALQRIKDGVYAICEDCGCVVSSARLKALPFVRRCVECKIIAEKKRNSDDRRYF